MTHHFSRRSPAPKWRAGEVIASVLNKAGTYPYQFRWLEAAQSSAFLGILGGRQLGKDRVSAAFATADSLLNPGTRWNCFSASQWHAQTWIDDCRYWYMAFAIGLRLAGYDVPPLGTGGAKDNVATLELPNGSMIIARSATVRSAVGLRGNVLFNEVPVTPGGGRELFGAVYPIVTGARDNGRNARMIMMANASHRGSFWHEWWTGEASKHWRKIKTTWTEAMRSRGKAAAWIAEKRAERIQALGSGAFLQWFECVWRAAEECYFDPKILARQTRNDLDPAEWPIMPRDPQTIGYDVGRVRNPAAAARIVMSSSGRYVQRTHAWPRLPYRAQRAEIFALARERPTRAIVVDATGMGDNPAEDLASESAGKYTVIPFKVTASGKYDLASRFKTSLEGGKLYLPASDLDLRMELESVEAHLQDSRVSIHIPEEGDRHGDRAFAAMLAEHGANSGEADYWSNVHKAASRLGFGL